MLFLLLAILCSASIALIFKHSESADRNRYAITSANYLAACIASAILLAAKRLSLPPDFAVGDALREIADALAANGTRLSPGGSIAWAVLVGLGAGAFVCLGFLFYQIGIRRHGVGLAGAFAKLGILVPMSLALVLWREMPTAMQWAGIALAAFSIVLVNWPSQGNLKRAVRPALLLLCLFVGVAEFSNKVFQKYGLPDHKALFLLVVFFVAFVCSLAATAANRKPVRRGDVLTGLVVGLPNIFSAYFMILALDRLPAAVAFAAYGAGTIVVINLAGALLFKEKLSRRELAVVALTIIALVLINVSSPTT